MSGELVRLRSAGASALVDPAQGGRLASLVIEGREVLVTHGVDAFHWGSFPMAPWVGRLRHAELQIAGGVVRLPANAPPHALHGLVTHRAWTVTAADERDAELTVDLGGGPASSAEPWPWPCRVTQTVSLTEGRIDFRLSVQAQEPMPADIGWHPWFVRELPSADGSTSAQLDVNPGRMYLNDAEGLPTGELGSPVPRPWDYCFIDVAKPPTIRWPRVLELTVESDCDHWVIYDMESNGICVEPWSGPPNSLNTETRKIVTPGHPLHASMSWTWRHLSR